MKNCDICLIEIKDTKRVNICSKCLVKIRRYKCKKKAIEYKGGKCIDCGYNQCDGALEFHHTSDKNFVIGNAQHKSWEDIKKELDKCDLVCANCHRVRHDNRSMYSKWLNASYKDYKKKKIKKVKKISNKPTKEWLSQLVWMLPTTIIAEIYKVSDKGVEKWCQVYNIDKPPRGYWSKK